MMELSNIPKLIDDLVIGILRSISKIIIGFLRISIRPFFGSLRSYADQKDINSRTTLFFSSMVFSLFLWYNVNVFHKIEFSIQDLRILLKGILIYIVFDLISRLFAIFSTNKGRNRRRAKSMLRHAFATSLFFISLFILLMRYLLEDSNNNKIVIFLTDNSNVFIIISALYILFSIYHAPFVYYCFASRSQSGSTWRRWTISVIGMIFICMSFYSLFLIYRINYAVANEIGSGLKILASYCVKSSDSIDVYAAIRNDQDSPEIITALSFKLHLKSLKMLKYDNIDLADNSVYYSSYLKPDGGSIIAKENDIVLFHGSAKLTNFLIHMLAVYPNTNICRIESQNYIGFLDTQWANVVESL